MNDVSAAVGAWVDKWSCASPPPDENLEGSLDGFLPRDNPRVALDAIVAVLERIPADPKDRYFQLLAAGPLENLLTYHGTEFLTEIEALARKSPAFRLLLNGVWFGGVSAPVSASLEKYLGSRW